MLSSGRNCQPRRFFQFPKCEIVKGPSWVSMESREHDPNCRCAAVCGSALLWLSFSNRTPCIGRRSLLCQIATLKHNSVGNCSHCPSMQHVINKSAPQFVPIIFPAFTVLLNFPGDGECFYTLDYIVTTGVVVCLCVFVGHNVQHNVCHHLQLWKMAGWSVTWPFCQDSLSDTHIVFWHPFAAQLTTTETFMNCVPNSEVWQADCQP